jgi:hypothetical protein
MIHHAKNTTVSIELNPENQLGVFTEVGPPHDFQFADVFHAATQGVLTEYIARKSALCHDRIILLIVFGVLFAFTLIRLIGVLMS